MNTKMQKQDAISKTGQQERSNLFLIRLWSNKDGMTEDEVAWNGRVQHVLTGEAHSFLDWPALIDTLVAMSVTSPSPKQDRDDLGKKSEISNTK